MGRRIVRFLLGSLYVTLLAALLITHTRQISGEIERVMALLETLLLAASAIVALALYTRMKEPRGKGGGPDEEERDLPETSARREILTREELREKIGNSALTEREWEIAWLLYRGYTNRQIAEEFCIAENTVKKHASHIYEKLQVSGRKEFREKNT